MMKLSSSGLEVYGISPPAEASTSFIPHPKDPSKTLVHAALEGPEVGLYYRGEGQLP